MPRYFNAENSDADEVRLFSLRENQIRHYYTPKKELFIAESSEVIRLALEAGYRPLCALCEQGKEHTLPHLPEDTPVYLANSEYLRQLAGFELVRGALCAMERRPLADPKEIVSRASRVAVLDHINNPTNVGAIIRSAAALGMDGVLITEDSSDPLYRRAIRVSMGTIFKIPWCYAPKNYIDTLKTAGFTTVALALEEDSVSIDDKRLECRDKLALILGSEGYGLEKNIVKQCDFTVKIPMYYGVDSLNVAAASAVAFWQLRKTK